MFKIYRIKVHGLTQIINARNISYFCSQIESILQYKKGKRKFLLGLLGLVALSTMAQNFGFKKFSTADGLMSNQIDALFIDSKNLLWIVNGNGISRFNDEYFANYLNDTMLTVVNKINDFSIRELKDGSIFSL